MSWKSKDSPHGGEIGKALRVFPTVGQDTPQPER
jgi:hypothetical protein